MGGDQVNEQYAHWIETLADLQGGRPGYSDQQPESLAALVKIARDIEPTKVIEIGTSYGLSLRAWLEVPSVEVIAIDMFFDPLRKSHEVLPFDWDRVDLIETDVLDVNLSALWKPDDVVILYFDCHGARQMSYVLNVISSLPDWSVVVVDDMWYSPEGLSENNVQCFFDEVVLPQIDASAPHCLRPKSYAPYWEGGSFFSFDEVEPLMSWVKHYRYKLHFEPGVKLVWWVV
jgi:predicted O-methyltransferase YrrM